MKRVIFSLNKLFNKSDKKQVVVVEDNCFEIKDKVYNLQHIVYFEKKYHQGYTITKYGLVIKTIDGEIEEHLFKTEKERDNAYKKLKDNLSFK